MALDEATAKLLAEMAASGIKPLHEMTPAEARGLGGMLWRCTAQGPRWPA
jgi:acetyl esterase